MRAILAIALLLAVANLVQADVYMHNPRGSNNRLHEANNNRANANRLFDSQNNNAGGYNVGPEMVFYVGSRLSVEWTNQHGCGFYQENVHCESIMQYMCAEQNPSIRDGETTKTSPDPIHEVTSCEEAECSHIGQKCFDSSGSARKVFTCESKLDLASGAIKDRIDASVVPAQCDLSEATIEELKEKKKGKKGCWIAADPKSILATGPTYGQHETYEYYAECKTRQRNKGLFHADQNINRNKFSARFTRQNNNGQRRGYECPEERDYYPYWHPTPWKDIAILTDSTDSGHAKSPSGDRCPYYQAESQNVKAKGFCEGGPWWNNPEDCARGGAALTGKDAEDKNKIEAMKAKAGIWKEAPAWGIDAPECFPAQFSRDNHLGNGLDGYTNSYNWTIPNDISPKCVFRIRYNITTADYDAWNINSTWDGKEKSPIKQDPTLDEFYGLTLAINTAQFGRTFQDRSHIFEIRARPDDVSDDIRIVNINVRGKRGNIVQVFPAVEYDFAPAVALIFPDTYVHFQWTGSDNNPNGNDGEGAQGTDRSNVVQAAGPRSSYPMHIDDQNMWLDVESDKYENLLDMTYGMSRGEAQSSGGTLDQASAYFNAGLMRFQRTGTSYFISSRNNNFSNRAQKGRIDVNAESAALTTGYTMPGTGWRYPQKNEVGVENGGVGGGASLKGGKLAAVIIAPIAAVGLAAIGFMMYKRNSGDSGGDSYRAAADTPRVPPRV